MTRSTPNRQSSHDAYKRRVGRTHSLNLALARRGGIRL